MSLYSSTKARVAAGTISSGKQNKTKHDLLKLTSACVFFLFSRVISSKDLYFLVSTGTLFHPQGRFSLALEV